MQTVVENMATQYPSVTKKLMKDIVTSVLDTITDVTALEGRVAIKNHIFKKQVRAARKGRNPKTGESMDIPSKTVISYKNTKGIM